VALNRQAKGDLAELEVAPDIRARRFKVAFPYGEAWDFDARSDARSGTRRSISVTTSQRGSSARA